MKTKIEQLQRQVKPLMEGLAPVAVWLAWIAKRLDPIKCTGAFYLYVGVILLCAYGFATHQPYSDVPVRPPAYVYQ